jgi:YaiO family outer membrane protein
MEYLDARRFDTGDYALALDAYVDTWRRAYMNLRYQYAPNASVFPRDSYRAEVFQGIGKGWELSGSYDHLDFTGSSTSLYGVGIGTYTGDWYFRWRTLFIPSAARLGVSNRALARYYYAGNSDDFIEINGGFSSGGDFVQGTTIVEATRGHGFGAVYQTYFDPRWGCKVAAGYYDEKTTVEQSIVEKSISLKVMTRW